jgi:hypothetical protein
MMATTDEIAQKQAQDAASHGTPATERRFERPDSIVSPTYQPWSTGQGLQEGVAGDVGYNGNAPGQGEQYASAALGYYGAGNVPGVSNNTQSAYNSMDANAGAAPAANMSAYYDNASRKSADAINKQMAARGSYGSSNAVGNLMSAETDLRAQQARDEAQYGLQRGQYGLQRAGLAGSLAQGADAQSVNAANNERAWTMGLGDMAFKGQDTAANRYAQGNADAMSMANTLSGMEGANYGQQQANDQSLMEAAMNAESGYATQGVSDAANNAAQNNNETKDAIKFGTDVVRSAF